MKTFTKIFCLALPILLFFVLVIPYSWVNGEYIVDWLGCGCPVYNEDTGTTETNKFNANDFTACFWLFFTVATGDGKKRVKHIFVSGSCSNLQPAKRKCEKTRFF